MPRPAPVAIPTAGPGKRRIFRTLFQLGYGFRFATLETLVGDSDRAITVDDPLDLTLTEGRYVGRDPLGIVAHRVDFVKVTSTASCGSCVAVQITNMALRCTVSGSMKPGDMRTVKGFQPPISISP